MEDSLWSGNFFARALDDVSFGSHARCYISWHVEEVLKSES